MTPKLFKAADVCELAQVQPYVLRSWEKEFPGIGVQKSADAPRFYRQSDVDQVLRIKQLVFGEGLTVAGARRRLEEAAPPAATVARKEVAEALDVLGADARMKIAGIRDGLRAIHELLAERPGAFMLEPPPNGSSKKRAVASAPLRMSSRAKAADAPRQGPKDHLASKKASAAPKSRRRAHA